MIKAYPKIFTIGTDYIKDIFNEDVEVTEKIDGSQIAWAKIDDTLYIRSKGQMLYTENPEKMFVPGIEYLHSIKDKIPERVIGYGEYLQKPKHNALAYSRVPKNNIILFGIIGLDDLVQENIDQYAELFDLERVPVLYRGKINTIEHLVSFFERESILGGVKIEGVVVKNFFRRFLLGGQPMPLMVGKVVSEAFKETHREKWGENKGKGQFETFKESFRTEARWQKAIQHLQEKGQLENAPKDIGSLIKEVQQDILAEETEAIKDWLFKQFKPEILRKSTAGLPEWYKQKLMERSLEYEKSDSQV